MTRSDKKNSRIVQWALPLMILFIFLFVSLFSYSGEMRESAEKKALDRVSMQAVSIAGYYDGVISTLISASQSAADYFLDSKDLFSDENVRLLFNMKKDLGVENIYVAKSDGSVMNYKGNQMTTADMPKEFKQCIIADSVHVLSLSKSGLPIVFISSPIRTEKEWLGNVVIEFKSGYMAKRIDATVYSYALVFSNGLIGECVGADNMLYSVGDNIREKLDGVQFVDGSKSIFEQNVKAGKSGSVAIINTRGYKQYLTYQPIGKYGSCVVVSVMDNQIRKSVRNENRETTTLIMKIVISISIFVVLVLVIYIINRIGFARQSRELQNKAETDLLTDLYNKISTEKKIQEYLDGEGKDKISMMCVLDIDNFKKINDTMGHAFGDEVIATLGKRIKSEFRVTDIVGRIGGDEFVLFIKDLKTDEVIEREAKRIEMFFKDFQVGSYTKYSPTASVGAAIYPRDAYDYESLYKAGDTALYKAKKRGKNQLAFYKDATDEDKNEAAEAKQPKD